MVCGASTSFTALSLTEHSPELAQVSNSLFGDTAQALVGLARLSAYLLHQCRQSQGSCCLVRAPSLSGRDPDGHFFICGISLALSIARLPGPHRVAAMSVLVSAPAQGQVRPVVVPHTPTSRNKRWPALCFLACTCTGAGIYATPVSPLSPSRSVRGGRPKKRRPGPVHLPHSLLDCSLLLLPLGHAHLIGLASCPASSAVASDRCACPSLTALISD